MFEKALIIHVYICFYAHIFVSIESSVFKFSGSVHHQSQFFNCLNFLILIFMALMSLLSDPCSIYYVTYNKSLHPPCSISVSGKFRVFQELFLRDHPLKLRSINEVVFWRNKREIKQEEIKEEKVLRPTLKILWFAVYRPPHHFTPDPIIVFGNLWKKNLFLLLFYWQIVSFFWMEQKKNFFFFLPIYPAWKFWVSKQQTNMFLKLAILTPSHSQWRVPHALRWAEMKLGSKYDLLDTPCILKYEQIYWSK